MLRDTSSVPVNAPHPSLVPNELDALKRAVTAAKAVIGGPAKAAAQAAHRPTDVPLMQH